MNGMELVLDNAQELEVDTQNVLHYEPVDRIERRWLSQRPLVMVKLKILRLR